MATKPANDAQVSDVMGDEESRGAGNMAPARRESPFALGVIDGDFTAQDLRLPRLQIAYGVGSLSERFNPGDWVLADDNLLASKNEPLNIVILQIHQYWKEYFQKYDPQNVPRSFDHEEEVHAVGGTTKWENGVGPTFNRAMRLNMLIEQPKDLSCGLFGITIADKQYAIAVWDVDKSAFRRVGPAVLTAAQFSLRKRGMLSGIFQISTRTETINKNPTIVPNIKLAGFNSDETIAGIRELFAPEEPQA